jgi:hypothetical protein
VICPFEVIVATSWTAGIAILLMQHA